jgi:hypothetical protein
MLYDVETKTPLRTMTTCNSGTPLFLCCANINHSERNWHAINELEKLYKVYHDALIVRHF